MPLKEDQTFYATDLVSKECRYAAPTIPLAPMGGAYEFFHAFFGGDGGVWDVVQQLHRLLPDLSIENGSIEDPAAKYDPFRAAEEYQCLCDLCQVVSAYIPHFVIIRERSQFRCCTPALSERPSCTPFPRYTFLCGKDRRPQMCRPPFSLLDVHLQDGAFHGQTH